MIYKKEVVDFISSTQKTSSLRFFADKFTEKIGYDGELQNQVSDLKDRIAILQQEINESSIQRRFNAAKKNIELKIMKLLPF